MKIKVLKEDQNSLLFEWHTSQRMANVFRKAITNEVPTLAIEDVSVYENSSVFFDEFIALRLGLIPIQTNLKGMKVEDTVQFTLEKTGPGTVTSGDLKFKDKATSALHDNIPIIELAEEQRLRLEGTAQVSTGKEHVKWQPALVTYQAYPKITIDSKATKKLLEEIANACPGAYEFDGKTLKIADPTKYDMLAYGAELSSGAVKLESEDDKVIFYIESFGLMPPRELFEKGATALEEKAKDFTKALKKA